jgi:hypothetical protein
LTGSRNLVGEGFVVGVAVFAVGPGRDLGFCGGAGEGGGGDAGG